MSQHFGKLVKSLQSLTFIQGLIRLSTWCIVALWMTACAVTETQKSTQTHTVATFNTPYHGEKHAIIVGSFANNSTYMRGLFSDGVDRLGGQAKIVLQTHLQQTNRFDLMDRSNMQALATEAGYNGTAQQIQGASFAVIGSVTEFGRRTSGDTQLFGILGQGKTQMAYAKVMLNIVDVNSSRIVYASQGAGEVALNSRQVVGFGTKTGYDNTLNHKVLDLAIREAVNALIEGLERGAWSLD
ncbi:MAG: curli production assembly protein CsgG [Alteromonadaceae bacterium]|nr:MAG: curli production assembly protein CsgG [Alteromonadaceae bacterium]